MSAARSGLVTHRRGQTNTVRQRRSGLCVAELVKHEHVKGGRGGVEGYGWPELRKKREQGVQVIWFYVLEQCS